VETAAGPHVTVTSATPNSEARSAPTASGVTPSFPHGLPVRDPETDLLHEIDAERKRVAVHAGEDQAEPAEPPPTGRST
jgi:hypothetical protein